MKWETIPIVNAAGKRKVWRNRVEVSYEVLIPQGNAAEEWKLF